MKLSALLLTTLAVLAVPLQAQHWPQFRGTAAGIAPDDPALPETWSETANVVWKIDIPGRAWSSPVVWGITSSWPPRSMPRRPLRR